MEELIKITQDTSLGQVVSARELYEFLEVNSNFTTWCKRMFEYGFEQDIDFIPILEESTGGRPSIDYALTLDTAKEISMIQRSEKGRQARRYFIQCEKVAKSANLPHNTFSIKEGKIMTDTNLIAKTSGIPISEINQNVKNWIDSHCDVILEGDPTIFQ